VLLELVEGDVVLGVMVDDELLLDGGVVDDGVVSVFWQPTTPIAAATAIAAHVLECMVDPPGSESGRVRCSMELAGTVPCRSAPPPCCRSGRNSLRDKRFRPPVEGARCVATPRVGQRTGVLSAIFQSRRVILTGPRWHTAPAATHRGTKNHRRINLVGASRCTGAARLRAVQLLRVCRSKDCDSRALIRCRPLRTCLMH
jgi:hypothetical protein